MRGAHEWGTRTWVAALAVRQIPFGNGKRRKSLRGDVEKWQMLEPEMDDTLNLFFMCCHPVLSAPSSIALTLRALGGLTTTEIAHAFLVPETTMAQRISRAKATIRSSGVRLESQTAKERTERLRAVLHVL
jgi:predicted RNA polymerase sigma factor